MEIIYQDSNIKISRRKIRREQDVLIVEAKKDVKLAYAIARAMRETRRTSREEREFEINERKRIPTVEYDFQHENKRETYVRFPISRVNLSEDRYEELYKFEPVDGEMLKAGETLTLTGRYEL